MPTLLRHRGTLYHRSIIPKSLRPFFHGKVQFWRSLRTSDRELAGVRSAQLEYQARRLFYILQHRGSSMDKAQVTSLIRQWQNMALEAGEDERIAKKGKLSDNDLDKAGTALSVALEATHEALVSCDYGSVAGEVDELLAVHKLPALDHSSEAFRRLARELLKAKLAVFRIEQEHWHGEYNGNGHAPTLPVVADTSSAQRPPTKPFSEVAARYFKEHRRAERTDAQIRAGFAKFLGIIGGDKPIGDITKADCRLYKETLLKSVGISTANKNLHSLSHLWNWALAQGFILEGSTSPVAGLLINKRLAKKEKMERKPFTDADLSAILSHKEFLSQRTKAPERYWLVLCLLLSGARREEIAQLALSDIRQEDGIHFFDITNEGESQSLKNGASKRRVPIHSELIRLGLMEYVAATKKRLRTERLFPQLLKGGNGYGDAVGKWFGRFIRSIGISDPALVLHSTRHTVITRLHAAGAPHNLVEILVGHASNSVHGTIYTHREHIPLKLLAEALERLQYAAVSTLRRQP
jgi:integrase